MRSRLLVPLAFVGGCSGAIAPTDPLPCAPIEPAAHTDAGEPDAGRDAGSLDASDAPETPDAETADALQIDAGDEYVRASSTSIVGASGGLTVQCDGSDGLVGGECFAREGTIIDSAADGLNGWRCGARPLIEEKGSLVIAWVRCRR